MAIVISVLWQLHPIWSSPPKLLTPCPVALLGFIQDILHRLCVFVFLPLCIVSLVLPECELHEDLHFVIVYFGSLEKYREENGNDDGISYERTNLCFWAFNFSWHEVADDRNLYSSVQSGVWVSWSFYQESPIFQVSLTKTKIFSIRVPKSNSKV